MSEAILTRQTIEQERYQTKEWTPAKLVYTGLMAFNLMSFLWLLVTKADIELPVYILLTRISAAFLAIWLGKLWKDKGFWILAVYTILFCLRAFIPNPSDIFTSEISQSILSALWLFCGCYGLGRVLNQKQLKKSILFCTVIWITGITITCLFGIYSTWTGTDISIMETAAISTYSNRLNLFYVATVSGIIIETAALLSGILFVCADNKKIRICFGTSHFITVLALALTDSRTAYISYAIGTSIIIYISKHDALFGQIKNCRILNRSRIRKAYKLLCIILIITLIMGVLLSITPVFNQIKTISLIPRAYAEELNNSQISNRGFRLERILSGRYELWEEIFGYLRKNPLVILIGESKILPLRNIRRFYWYDYAHCHNIFIQVLMEDGIPGIILLILFIIFIIRRSYHIVQNTDYTIWIRLLPALIISFWISDLAECVTWLRSSQCPMNAILFISAGVISAQYSYKQKLQ